MKKTNKKKGFTIVELVIVIAVIAILAAVLIPTFAGVVDKANKSSATQAGRNAYVEAKAEVLDDGIIEEDETVYLTKNGTILTKVGEGSNAKYYSKLVYTDAEESAVDTTESVEGTLEWTFVFDQDNSAEITSETYGSKYTFSVVEGVYSCTEK